MNIKSDFGFAVTPQLHFGCGKLSVLPAAVSPFGKKILLITGARSFFTTDFGNSVLSDLAAMGVSAAHYRVAHEPSPAIIDDAVNEFSPYAPDCIVAVGGGSVLDAGKAISAMLPLRSPVKDFLEGVGTKAHPGTKIPFVAVPTTSGTGSEATKNAVISETGDQGYKRSLRHNNFVPNLAVVDPLLTVSCPPSVTAASGMDAFTQLLESYVSTAANAITDALAIKGLECIAGSLRRAYDDGANAEARTGMALASYLSGIALANAGLGLVHGFASPIGGFFSIGHGIICSSLMTPANEVTVRKLRMEKTNPQALAKFSQVGKLFARSDHKSEDYYVDFLLHVIQNLTADLKIPPLSSFGVKPSHFAKIVAAAENKNNPVVLHRDEMLEVLEKAG